MRITIHAKPNAWIAKVVEISGKELEVSIPARATDGRANEKLIEILAEHFATSKSLMRILSGHNGKTKIVEIK